MNLSHEEIAKRAFEIWDREGRREGRDADNWYRAEAELQSGQHRQQTSSRDSQMMKPGAQTAKATAVSPLRPQVQKDPQLTSQDPAMLKPAKRRKPVGAV